MRDPIEDINPVRVVIVVIFSVAFFLVQRHYWPDLYVYIPPSLLIIGGCFTVYFLGKSIWWKFRDTGYRVQVGGVSGSINGPPALVPDPSRGKGFYWALYGLGAVPPFKGKLALLVVPYHQIYVDQGFHSGLTMVRPWSKFRLPSVVQKWLDDYPTEFNSEKVFFGCYSRSFIDRSGEKEMAKEEQLRAKDSLIGVLEKSNVNKFDHYEDLKNIMGKVTGEENWFKKTLRRLKKKEEEEP